MILRRPDLSGLWRIRAGNGIRTRDPQLGKLMLYQLSYSRLVANVMRWPPWLHINKPPCGVTYF